MCRNMLFRVMQRVSIFWISNKVWFHPLKIGLWLTAMMVCAVAVLCWGLWKARVSETCARCEARRPIECGQIVRKVKGFDLCMCERK